MEEEIFRITKDKRRAQKLMARAKDRLELLKLIPKEKMYKIIEEYYEVIKELLIALMYAAGYKTLSHKALIEYFASTHKELSNQEIKLIDTLRKFRIGSVYYGEEISSTFLLNHEDRIKRIIKVLIKMVENETRGI